MGLTAENKANHVTDVVADALQDATDTVSPRANPIPGPSSNPATNLIINDIVLRSAGRLSRRTMEKMLLGRKFDKQFAKDVVENRSILHSLAAYGVTKLATRSVPGAAIVGGGLLVKVLFDRSQSRRKARRQGRKQLRAQADPNSLA